MERDPEHGLGGATGGKVRAQQRAVGKFLIVGEAAPQVLRCECGRSNPAPWPAVRLAAPRSQLPAVRLVAQDLNCALHGRLWRSDQVAIRQQSFDRQGAGGLAGGARVLHEVELDQQLQRVCNAGRGLPDRSPRCQRVVEAESLASMYCRHSQIGHVGGVRVGQARVDPHAEAGSTRRRVGAHGAHLCGVAHGRPHPRALPVNRPARTAPSAGMYPSSPLQQLGS